MRVIGAGAVAAFTCAAWMVGALVMSTPAAACAISPGTTTCAPDLITVDPSSTLVATTSGTMTPNSSPPNAPTFTATYTENVYRDPSNTYCANCLDWVVKITNNQTSTDTLARVTISDFSGFLTDMGYINPPGTAPGLSNNGTVTPNNVSRSSTGSTLRWDFTSAEIMPGQTTVLLAVMTNSTRVVPGTISVQDGTAVSATAFGPATPEIPWVPAIGLVGTVLAGTMLYRRRRVAA